MLDNSYNSKNINFANVITMIIVVLFLMSFSIGLVILPKKDFSESENRSLAAFPVINLENIVNGSYMDEITVFLEDHFPLRDFWIGIKTETEILMGRNEINGVLIGKNGYLFGLYEEPENTERIVSSFTNIANIIADYNEDINVGIMIVPTSVTVYGDYLPGNYTLPDQLKIREDMYLKIFFGSENVNIIDCFPLLYENPKNGQLYYKTDHHWTTLGAYYGYVSYINSIGLTPKDLEDYDASIVTNDFHGTYSSKVNRMFEEGDAITVYNDEMADLTVVYEDTGEVSNSLYNFDYLETKDKYSLFLNNLHTQVTINNNNANTDRVLLLIKDSYANSMVPYLVSDFKTIYVLDTRYYKFGPSSFIKEHDDITDVLILYNMGTMDDDAGIRAIF